MSTTTNLSSLVINYLTQSQYDAAAQAGTLNENQIYLTPAVEFTETDPTVPSWAKQTNKPSYNFSEIGSTPTTLSGYGITNAYTKTEVDGLVSGVLHYKGTKTSSSALPSSGNTTGDVWHVTDTGAEYAWDGSTWQELGTAVDLSGYLLSSEISSWAKQSTKPSYALSELTGAADVQAIEGLTGTSGFLKKTAANTWTLDTNTYLTSASTLDATKLSGTIPSGCYTDTNTTYTLSNALASHKFTSTLTAGGSGSGTSTAIMEFVAGTGITLTDDTSNKKITIASSVVNTDEKLKTAFISNNTTYYPILGDATTTAETKNYSTYLTFISNWNSNTGIGTATLGVGNTTGIEGKIAIRSASGYAATIQTVNLSDAQTISIPNKTGTVALTSDTFQSTTATLTTAGWSSKTQTVNVTGATASNTVVVSPAPTSHVAYCEAGIYCSAQGAGTLTFTCDEVPESALTVNILYK